MKDDFTTNSHYLIYTFLFRKVGRMYFLNLGVKGLTYNFWKITASWERRRPSAPSTYRIESSDWFTGASHSSLLLLAQAIDHTFTRDLAGLFTGDWWVQCMALRPAYLQWYFRSCCTGCAFDRCLRELTQKGSIMRWVNKRCSTISTYS